MSPIGSLGMKREGCRNDRLLVASLGLLLMMAGVCAAQVPGAVEKQLEQARAERRAQCLTACHRNLDKLSEACANYFADNGRYPKSCSQLVPKYLSSVPTCGGSHSETYRIRQDQFRLECRANHEPALDQGLGSMLSFSKTAK